MSTSYVESTVPLVMPWYAARGGGTALLVLLLGVCTAAAARYAVTWILERGGFASLCDRSGFTEFLRKGEVGYSPARLAGACIYWIILLATLLWTFDLLGFGIAAVLVGRIESALPSFVSTTVILIVGYALVVFLANVTRTIAMNAVPAYAGLLAKALSWVGAAFVLFICAEQLGFGTRVILVVVQIVLGALALGLALAFGLGCKDLARDAMVRFLHHMKERSNAGKPDMEG